MSTFWGTTYLRREFYGATREAQPREGEPIRCSIRWPGYRETQGFAMQDSLKKPIDIGMPSITE